MTIIGTNNISVQVRGTQRGVNWVTRLDYSNLESPGYTAIGAFSDEFMTTVIPLWLEVLALDCVIDEFEVYVYGSAPDISLLTPVNANGLVVSDALPPFVSQRIFKLPNNSAIEGSDTTPFKKGRIAIPGVPETAQHNGILTAAHQAKLQDLAGAIANIQPAAPFDDLLYLYMYRLDPASPGGLAVSAAPVLTCAASNQLGTQNSRKR